MRQTILTLAILFLITSISGCGSFGYKRCCKIGDDNECTYTWWECPKDYEQR